MDRQERAGEYLQVVGLLSKARTLLDALSVGDPSPIPNTLKHLLDEPIERTRSYARALMLGGEHEGRGDRGEGEGEEGGV